MIIRGLFFISLCIVFCNFSAASSDDEFSILNSQEGGERNIRSPMADASNKKKKVKKLKNKARKKKTAKGRRKSDKAKKSSKTNKKEKVKIKSRKFKKNGRKGNRKKQSKSNKKKTNKGSRQKLKIKSRKSKKNGGSENKKKQSKSIKKKKSKGSKQKIKIKSRKGRKKVKKSRQTCSGDTPVTSTCTLHAQEVLVYEANQVTNYLKQSKQLLRHANQTGSKKEKKGNFEEAAKHILIAVGGNTTNPSCGDANATATRLFGNERALDITLGNYDTLMNCSSSVEEACTPPPKSYNADIEKTIESCTAKMDKFRTKTKSCMTEEMKKDATKQCKCWSEANTQREDIKKDKCTINDKKKAVTKQKKVCTDAFKVCKKAEDASVKLIETCMGDHSMPLLNMTGASLNSGAMDDTKQELDKAEDTAKEIVEGGKSFEFFTLSN